MKRIRRPKKLANKRKGNKRENGKSKRLGGGNALIVAVAVGAAAEIEISIDVL